MQLPCQPRSATPVVVFGRFGEPPRLCDERAELTENRYVWQHEPLAEVMEHPFAVVAPTELERSRAHERSYVSAKALWRGVVEVIRDVGDREARILEQPGCTNEPRDCQVSFWRR